jgi:hypothetical protein
MLDASTMRADSPPQLPALWLVRHGESAGNVARDRTEAAGATVSSFRLDKYEVTVGRFRAFVNAGMGTMANPPVPDAGAHANIAGSGWKVAWSNLGSGVGLAPNKAQLLVNLNCSPAGEKPGGRPGWTPRVPTRTGR